MPPFKKRFNKLDWLGRKEEREREMAPFLWEVATATLWLLMVVTAKNLSPWGGVHNHLQNPSGVGFWINYILMKIHVTDLRRKRMGGPM